MAPPDRTPLAPEPNRLTSETIAAAIEVHRLLGPGMLERIYQDALATELRRRGITVRQEVPVEVTYKQETLGRGLRLDLLVEGTVVIEVKAIREVTRVHRAQLLSYLRTARKPVGLLLNFHTERLVDDLHRIVSPGHPELGSSR